MRERGIAGIEGSSGGFVGCGFAVTSRHILTCAHVVNAALGRTGDAAKSCPGAELKIRFPYLQDASPLRAKVVYWKPPAYDVQKLPSANLGVEEDIAGLELLDPLPSIESIQLEDAIAQAQFKVFGYPKKTSQGAIAEGKIQDKLPLGWFQIDGTCPEGLWAEPGYSGTAVWGHSTEAVCYGMVVAAKTREDGSKTAYMIPAQKLQPAIATLQLLESLSRPQVTPEDLPKIYRAAYQPCCPPDWHLDRPYPESLSEIVSELQEMGDSAITVVGKSISRMLEFAARLAIHPNMPAAKILGWGQLQLPEFAELIDDLRLAETEREARQRNADPCLIFEVSSDQAPYRTRAFWLPDAHSYHPEDQQTYEELLCWDFENEQETIADLPGCSLAELPDRLSGYFRTGVERNYLTGQFRLELLLPLSLMDQPIERWSLTHSPYGTTIPGGEYPVVVRCTERATRDYRKFCGTLWQTNWDNVQKHLTVPSHSRMAVVSPLAKAEQLKAHYRANSIIGFKLNDVPQKKFFEALLGAAAPVAVWLRQSPHQAPDQATDDDRSLLQWLEDFLQCQVGQLPHEALRVRAEAIAYSETPEDSNFMIGHHLSLLWENPHLQPPRATKTISESL